VRDEVDTLARMRKHLCLVVQASSGSVTACKIGDGRRMLFLRHCDGKTLVAYNSMGESISVRRDDLLLVQVLGLNGKPVKHGFNAEGHLLVWGAPDVDPVDFGPWEKYVRKQDARKAKKNKHTIGRGLE
jgi:hypothetical protein